MVDLALLLGITCLYDIWGTLLLVYLSPADRLQDRLDVYSLLFLKASLQYTIFTVFFKKSLPLLKINKVFKEL